jgi:hypothetical protein
MLSILPKHVADEMLKDMKKDESQKDQQQFNTMYMYRHENVRYGGGETKCVTGSTEDERQGHPTVCTLGPLSQAGVAIAVDGRVSRASPAWHLTCR